MKKILTLLIAFIGCFAAQAQDKEVSRDVIDRLTDSVMAEGKALYHSEWASWYGTDIFLAKCKGKRDRLGGYLSYETADGVNNILFTRGDVPTVLATISFKKDLKPDNYTLDTAERQLKKDEQAYYDIRQAALERLKTDTTFKFFKNTNLNAVPLIDGKGKRVYFLAAPHQNGVVLFGNDYLIRFGDKVDITSVYKIHNSLLTASAGDRSDSSKIVTSYFHSHIPGKDEFMSASDICTTLLYAHLTTWQQAYVMSRKYVSILDIPKQTLLVLTMEAWKRISDDQQKRHLKQ